MKYFATCVALACIVSGITRYIIEGTFGTRPVDFVILAIVLLLFARLQDDDRGLR